jgi:hypothetical protein
MKFLSTIILSTLSLSLNAVGTPTVEARGPSLVERDLATVTGVISAIQAKVKALDSAINSYNGGDVSAVQSASDSVVSAINSGVATVKGSGDLSQNDALQLPGPVQELTKDVQSAVNDIISKKDKIVAACQGAQTLKDLQQQKTASGALADAITSKVPSSLQGIASQLSSGITAAIQKGIDSYQNAGGCSSSSSSSASSASSATGTGAATSATSATSATITTTATSPGSAAGSSSASSARITSSSKVVSSTPTSGSGSGSGGSTTTGSTGPLSTGAASAISVSSSVGIIAALAVLFAF